MAESAPRRGRVSTSGASGSPAIFRILIACTTWCARAQFSRHHRGGSRGMESGACRCRQRAYQARCCSAEGGCAASHRARISAGDLRAVRGTSRSRSTPLERANGRIPDDDHGLSALDGQVDAIEDELVAIALHQMPKLDHPAKRCIACASLGRRARFAHIRIHCTASESLAPAKLQGEAGRTCQHFSKEIDLAADERDASGGKRIWI